VLGLPLFKSFARKTFGGLKKRWNGLGLGRASTDDFLPLMMFWFVTAAV